MGDEQDLASKMQVLGVLVAILIVSGATDVEEEERAVIQGFHCDYLILSDVPSLSGCNDGFKFVIRKRRGVRSQYLILGGKTVLAFLKQGQKFSRCRSFNNITPRVTCKGPVGGLKPNFTPANWTAGGDGAGQICAQVICCGSDGVTFSSPCAAPAGVTCVDYNECPAPEPPLPPVGCPGCPVTGGAVLSEEHQAIVDWTVEGLQGSDGLCKKTKVEVNNFSTQVVAGTMYEFDLVLDHAEDSASECGAPDGLREVCHMAVWEKVWEDFREVQWDRSTCIRPGSN